MPYGLTRYQQAESLHFLTFSCYERKPCLTDPVANKIVEEILERTRARHDALIYAYVLMPEHVHIMMNEPPKIQVAMFLKAFKQEVSRKLKGARKQFWQTRYFDRNLRGEDSMAEVIRYIHRNPVSRGPVTQPEEYRWSSYCQYATGVPGVVQIESEWLAATRDRAAAKTHSSHETKAR
jgi:putative transposase